MRTTGDNSGHLRKRPSWPVAKDGAGGQRQHAIVPALSEPTTGRSNANAPSRTVSAAGGNCQCIDHQ